MRGWRSFRKDEGGAALVEFTAIAAVFFFMLFAAVEAGFLTMWWNQTEKAVGRASRELIVRPPLAANVPTLRGKNPNRDSTTIRFGALCGGDASTNACGTVATRSCTIAVADGSTTCADTTAAAAILERMRGLSPLALQPGRPGTVTVTYTDTGLGFVGGPYVPTVTVRVTGLRYPFFAMSGLSALLGGDGATGVDMPAIAVTLVGEDLAAGTQG